jgi:hypothetical protein
MFNAERSGVIEESVVRIHLPRWLEDEDAWTMPAAKSWRTGNDGLQPLQDSGLIRWQ